MAIVKNLAFISPERLKKLTSFSGFEYNSSNFTPFPLDIIHYLLPLKLKFLKETYAVIDNGRIYGLITLETDDCNQKKLKISQLFLEENSIEYGELLINYVVNKFLAKGAQSFYVVVDEVEDKLLKLFNDICKFRTVADEYLFKLKKTDFTYTKEQTFEFIRFSKNSESAKIAQFYNGLINSHQLPTFEINEKYFKDNIFVGLKNNVCFKYVLECEKSRKIFGYFVISTKNNKDFILEAALAPTYEIYLSDILKFAKHEISKRNSGWILHVKVKSYFMNHNTLLDVLKSYDFKYIKKSKILTKDLYKTAKSDNIVYDKRIIFNDITPAY